jgi:hypothetical protein
MMMPSIPKSVPSAMGTTDFEREEDGLAVGVAPATTRPVGPPDDVDDADGSV